MILIWMNKNKEIYFFEKDCMDLIKHTLNEEENN